MSSDDKTIPKPITLEDLEESYRNATRWEVTDNSVSEQYQIYAIIRDKLETDLRKKVSLKRAMRAYVFFVGSSKGLTLRSVVGMEVFLDDYLRMGTTSEGKLEAYSRLTTSYVSFIMNNKGKKI